MKTRSPREVDIVTEKVQLSGSYTTKDEIINQQFEGIILDEERVLKSVPFAEFITKKGELAIGLLLPTERLDQNGDVSQEWRPFVITSERTFHPIFNGKNQALGVKFDAIPSLLPHRYRLLLAKRWVLGKEAVPSAAEIYSAIRAAYEENLYFSKPWYAVHVVWDMATYFFGILPAFPYLELRGVRGAAKTKVMKQSGCFSFNASPIYTSPTEATLFRIVHDQRPTLYLDECENLFHVVKGKVEHDGRVEIINVGYEEGGTVPRMEAVGKKFVAHDYKAYCPKMLSSINGLHGATESRAIVHVMTRAPDNDPRGEREVNPADPRYQETREKLLLFTLGRWRDVKKNYDELTATALKKRELQLWRPLLSVARLLGPEVEKEILGVAQHQQQLNRAEDVSSGSWEYLLLERAYQLAKGGQRILYLKELEEAIPVEERPHNPKAIRRILDGLGFRDFDRVLDSETRRAGYQIPSIQDLERIIGTLNPSIISSFPSVSFDSRREEIIEELIETKESRRNPQNSEGIQPKETKESKETKAAYHLKEPVSWVLSQPGKVGTEAFVQLFGEEVLRQLKERGDVFEPRPGFLEVLR